MGISGTAVATEQVIVPAVTKPGSVEIRLTDAGEIRRLGRLLLAGRDKFPGGRTGAFAAELIEALKFTTENTAKR